MFRFNRFYLLFALVFSYVIPFVKINLPAISEQKNELIFDEIQTQQLMQTTNQVSDFDWMNLIVPIYILISIGLIIRIIISIRKIINLKGKEINYQNQKVKLVEKNLPPFSFWNKIYLNKSYFQNQQIDNRIFQHEKTHIVQKHSLDIIFLEILRIISWFNPALYFYKKAITDNHEFLADESIIQQKNNVKDYQTLILSEILQTQNLNLTHQFNYNNTKKRFIMMTIKKSKFEKTKKIVAVSAFAGLSLLFVQKVYAQNNKEKNAVAVLTKEKDYTESQRKMMVMYKAELKKKREPRGYDYAEKVIMDTIPSNKKVKVRKLKENELPIPPPPPPASNITAAQFPEGLNGLRKGIAEAFDSSALEGKGTITSNLYITIDENGKTTDIKAEGENRKFNDEAIKAITIATANKLWKPATEEGKEAATVFKLPITMNFQ
ncbi:M56 family metallopeptidase [Epilithonimonas sp.]|uniref:M56 family metallopeptidase n=1 Tax=Epilithonimonas sp. TaxID=2894511 RepID=UPI002FDDEB2A